MAVTDTAAGEKRNKTGRSNARAALREQDEVAKLSWLMDVFVVSAIVLVVTAIGVALVDEVGMPPAIALLSAGTLLVALVASHVVVRRAETLRRLSVSVARLESELEQIAAAPSRPSETTNRAQPDAAASAPTSATRPTSEPRSSTLEPRYSYDAPRSVPPTTTATANGAALSTAPLPPLKRVQLGAVPPMASPLTGQSEAENLDVRLDVRLDRGKGPTAHVGLPQPVVSEPLASQPLASKKPPAPRSDAKAGAAVWSLRPGDPTLPRTQVSPDGGGGNEAGAAVRGVPMPQRPPTRSKTGEVGDDFFLLPPLPPRPVPSDIAGKAAMGLQSSGGASLSRASGYPGYSGSTGLSRSEKDALAGAFADASDDDLDLGEDEEFDEDLGPQFDNIEDVLARMASDIGARQELMYPETANARELSDPPETVIPTAAEADALAAEFDAGLAGQRSPASNAAAAKAALEFGPLPPPPPIRGPQAEAPSHAAAHLARSAGAGLGLGGMQTEIGEIGGGGTDGDLPEALAQAAAMTAAIAASPQPSPQTRPNRLAPQSSPSTTGLQGKIAAIAEALAAERIDLFLEPIKTLEDNGAQHFEVMVRLRLEGDAPCERNHYVGATSGTPLLPLIDAVSVAKTRRVAWRLMQADGDGRIFTSLDGQSLVDAQFVTDVDQLMEGDNRSAHRMVLSFPQTDARRFANAHFAALARLAGLGFAFALDHITDLEMDFDRLGEAGFAFVKLDADVFLDGLQVGMTRVPADDICRHFASLGLTPIVGHIRDVTQLQRLRSCGVRFGQGPLLGAPRALRADWIAGQ